MKSIELTEDHKTKLLEMCKVLFPEYIEINLEINENYDGIQDYIQLRKKYENTTFIHWFEFCWLLLNKILELNLSPIKISKIIHDFGIICFNQSKWIHPVDYLYEEFKKLQPKEQYVNDHMAHIMSINKHVKK